MKLFNNDYFTIYRDSDLEAFYDVDLKNRGKLILAHIIIYFFPVLAAIMLTEIYSFDRFATWLIIFSFVLYIIAVAEITAYLFPKSRKLYKKYFLWIVIFLKQREKLDYKRFQEVSQEQSKVIELINGMQEIKLHNAE